MRNLCLALLFFVCLLGGWQLPAQTAPGQTVLAQTVLAQTTLTQARNPRLPPRPRIDQERLAAHGIRRVSGRHLTLFTDLPISPAIEELPKVFDAAVPIWCAHFETPLGDADEFKMIAYLIKDEKRFRDLGVLNDDVPKFKNGYHKDWEIWFFDQPSDYYRRHLLLHEGTHAFMVWRFRQVGPPWYMEGLAEWMGTHLWKNGKLRMGHFPGSKDEVPRWGRIRMIQDEVKAGRALTLAGVLKFPSDAHLRNEPYAWCWAACWFFQQHPLSREAFGELKKQLVKNPDDMSRWFYDRLQPHWGELNEQWQLLIMNVEFGYDLSRAIIQRKPIVPLPEDAADVRISATRGWQSTGYRLEAGRSYKIRAVGRYQLAKHPRIWWCEPGGVTIQYYRGRPLGMLVGAIKDDEAKLSGTTPLTKPQTIGLVRTLRAQRSGTLYLRINESVASLADNAGQLLVRIRPAP